MFFFCTDNALDNQQEEIDVAEGHDPQNEIGLFCTQISLMTESLHCYYYFNVWIHVLQYKVIC